MSIASPRQKKSWQKEKEFSPLAPERERERSRDRERGEEEEEEERERREEREGKVKAKRSPAKVLIKRSQRAIKEDLSLPLFSAQNDSHVTTHTMTTRAGN